MEATRIPEQKCSKCDYKIDACTDVEGKFKPKVGDVSMCLHCGHLTAFTETLSRRELTSTERESILANKDLVKYLEKLETARKSAIIAGAH